MINRLLASLLLIALILPILFLGCNINKTVKEEYNMVQKNTKPLIDTTAPDNLETATFALG
jgi:hypothetical protein